MATAERFALDKREQRRWLDQLPRRLVRLGENEGGQRAKLLLRLSKKAWKIPARVHRGYEIQIAIVTTAAESQLKANLVAWG